ncbi:unnamed protein product, partial [Didymodactylos carnosus]
GCLDFSGGVHEVGKDDKIIVYPCHGMKGNQHWTYKENGHIFHQVSSLCLALSTDNKHIQMEKCDESNSRLKCSTSCLWLPSRKASFIHKLLGYGDFLPADEGAVIARIIKFSYAPSEDACLIKYSRVVNHTEVEDQVDLSNCFKDNKTAKTRTKALRTLIKIHLRRPEGFDENSNEFVCWAKSLIEIRIPSPTLELGLHVYDTPGFLSSDASVLRENLLALLASVRPTLVFLYDNATVSDDSRKCDEQLKVARHSQLLGVDIFFLNMKPDVTVIRKNAINDDDDDADDNDDEKLLEKERLCRYKLLINVDEMKRRAIDRIILYAAEHDLRPSKFVISIAHASIDAFFDFILLTNRRSRDEWNRLRDDVLQGGEHFFQQYRDGVDRIGDEANRRLPQRFREKRKDIGNRAMADCETRGIHKVHLLLQLQYKYDNPFPPFELLQLDLLTLIFYESMHALLRDIENNYNLSTPIDYAETNVKESGACIEKYIFSCCPGWIEIYKCNIISLPEICSIMNAFKTDQPVSSLLSQDLNVFVRNVSTMALDITSIDFEKPWEV